MIAEPSHAIPGKDEVTMGYSDEVIGQLDVEVEQVNIDLRMLSMRLVATTAPALRSPKAVEYLRQGVCRRLETLRRATLRVFEVFPPGRTQLLDDEERSLVEVSLQAFLLNLYGVLDNTAWVLLSEKQVELKRKKVGLFIEATQQHVSSQLVQFVKSQKIHEWYDKYVKPYRDALAHRIPLYVPPAGLDQKAQEKHRELDLQIQSAMTERRLDDAMSLRDEQAQLGTVMPVFIHSYTVGDASPPMWLHLQLLVDIKTVMAILNVAFPML